MFVQALILVTVLGIVAWGYWRWIRLREVSIQGKGMLLLTIVTFVGGLVGSVGWWLDDPRSFSWDLPPVASRMLASAGWAFGVATLAALQRPVPHRLRLVMLMLAAYLVPLLVAVPLFHLDRFDPAAPITYGFFALVLSMTVAALWYLFQQPAIVPDEPAGSLPPTPLVGAWLGLVAAVTALWGLALFITDNGLSSLIWAWPGDLLTSRLIAVMLLTIAVGAAYALRYADVSRVMLGMIAVYGFGVTLANLWNILASKPVNPSYVGAFGIIFLVSATLLIAERQNTVERSRST